MFTKLLVKRNTGKKWKEGKENWWLVKGLPASSALPLARVGTADPLGSQRLHVQLGVKGVHLDLARVNDEDHVVDCYASLGYVRGWKAQLTRLRKQNDQKKCQDGINYSATFSKTLTYEIS